MRKDDAFLLSDDKLRERMKHTAGTIIAKRDHAGNLTGYCSLQPSLRTGKRLALCLDGPYVINTAASPEGLAAEILASAIGSYSRGEVNLADILEIYDGDILAAEKLSDHEVFIEALALSEWQLHQLVHSGFQYSHSFIDMACQEPSRYVKNEETLYGEYKVSIATPSEYPSLFLLLNKCFEHDKTQVVINRKYYEKFQIETGMGPSCFVLFQIKYVDRPIAFRLLIKDGDEDIGTGGYLGGIGVDPQFRGLGLAKLLMNESFRYCSTAQIEPLSLSVLTSNHIAIGLNKRFGFVEVGKAREYYSHKVS